jgi:conjugative transposon TraJ protein
MGKCKRAAILAAVGMLFPFLSQAQSAGNGVALTVGGLQGILDKVYGEMLPMCSGLIGVGSGIAGFAAIWYIASRVWRHIANAEPIDFYPLFRPFVLGFCVIHFQFVIALMNGILQPTVTGTAKMVGDSDKAVAALLKQKEEKIKDSDVWKMYVGENDKGDREKWYKYSHPDADPSDEGMFESVGNDMRYAMEKFAYKFQNNIKEWMSEILQVLFQAAALCINTLRTFQLIVLAILGPLVFGIAVFDGLQHTLTAWIARYINIFLWLPVCNIFGAIIGKIQELMLQFDLGQIQSSGTTVFSTTDAGYLIFMIIGIVGYFTVPSVANSIVNAGGMGAMLTKVTNISTSATTMAGGHTKQAGGIIASGGYGMDQRILGSGGIANDYDSHVKDKISGKPSK